MILSYKLIALYGYLTLFSLLFCTFLLSLIIRTLLHFTSNYSYCFYNHGQKIWNKREKCSKIGQDKKSWISTLGCFLTAIAKVLFVEGRMRTRLYLQPNLSLFSNLF